MVQLIGRRNRLRLLPAVAENEAVQTEVPKANEPKHKRRWRQFSLRSMLVITLICAVATDRLATAADFSVEIERLSKDHQGFFQMLHRGLLQLWLASLVKEIA